MASGTIHGVANHPSGQISVKVDWWETGADASTNTSVVNAILYISRNADGYTTEGTGTFGLDIADAGWVYDTRQVSLRGGAWVPVVALARTVPHNPDGSQAVWIRGSGSIPVTGWTSTDLNGVATLDTIPRASQPTLSAGTFDAGTPVTINTNRASASFSHTVRVAWGSRSQQIPGVGASTTWTMPLEWLDQIPNSTSAQGTIFVDTYSGGALIGTRHVVYTARVPASVVPTSTGLTVSDRGGAAAAVGAYVSGISQVQITLNGTAGAHGSTVKAVRTKYGAIEGINAATYPVTGSGSQTVSGTVTDSRGRTSSRSSSITVLPYRQPVVTSAIALRCNADGTLNQLGSHIKLTSAGNVASLPSGGEKNTLTWRLLYRQRGTSSWTTVKTVTAPAGTLSWSDTTVFGGGLLLPTLSWDVQVQAVDRFNTVVAQQIVTTGAVTFSWGRSGVGIGKIWERGALDVEGEAYQWGRTLSELYGPGRMLHDSPSAGVVITTDIAASEDMMWTLDVRVNSYLAGQGTGVLWAQGYQYAAGNSIIGTSAVATFAVGQLEAYNANGVLCWWLPIVGSAQTVAVSLAGDSGSLNHRVVSVAAGARPAGRSRPTLITPQVLGDGAGLPIGQAYVSILGANVNVGPGAVVSGLTQNLTLTAGYSYRVDAHLDCTITGDSLAVFELLVRGSARPQQLIAQTPGRFPLHKTWAVTPTSGGPADFAIRTSPASSPTGVGLAATHTTLTITRTR